jgi:threonine dehydrogenase-like Zn-dependent dehydrogenase
MAIDLGCLDIPHTSAEQIMKAAVFGDGGSIGIKERDLPEPEPGWVRIAVTAGGICGSDLHVMHSALGNPKGIRPGHEIAGLIDATGDDTVIETGTHVAVEPILGCGACHHCHVGRANLCGETRLFGIALPGGLAEYVCVPETLVHRLPEDLDKSSAALSEPMAVCVRGARIGRVSMGDRVVIIGAGTIGLLSILTARHAGAGEVLITARHPHQQALARALGADRVFDGAASLLAEVGDQHADVVVETVGGATDTLSEAVQIARTGGRIAVLGVFSGTPSIPGMPFFSKELTLAASNCYGREAELGDFALGAALATEHADLIRPLVTHTFSLDEVEKAFATAEDKSTRSIKVQIQP